MDTKKRTQKAVHKSTGDIVKSSGAETAPKNEAAQCLIKIIEQPTPVTDENVKSLIKVIKESRSSNSIMTSGLLRQRLPSMQFW